MAETERSNIMDIRAVWYFAGARISRERTTLASMRMIADPGVEQPITQPRDDKLVAIFRFPAGHVARCYSI
jgi:hypothetical protein